MNVFKQISAVDRQSLTDIAMQEYGCYEAVFTVLEDNADRLFAMDDVLIEGMKLNIRTDKPILNTTNKIIAEQYVLKDHKVLSHAIGMPHIVSVVSDYVTTDYISGVYTIPPPSITNVQVIANVSNFKAYTITINNSNGLIN